MIFNLILSRDKKIYEEKAKTNRKEFIEFVTNQFKELAKKKIRVPVRLYHL